MKLPKGAHGAKAKKTDDHQSDNDQTEDEISLSGISGVIHGFPPRGLGPISNADGTVI